jgi:hypothetical protein
VGWVSASELAVRRVGRFLRRNPWAIPILGFQALLLSCAVLLAVGFSGLAEGVANVAYFMLLFGVVAALIVFWRRGDGE